MSLCHPENWIWDFWFAVDPPHYHVFYLQAPRSLLDEKRRHLHASIGHAVSPDLRHWQVLPDALHPDTSRPGAWDDYTTWTGSVMKEQDLWYMFYTGTSRQEDALIQRIGMVTSADLLHWERCPQNPLLELDSRWYETLDLDHWHDQAWRDPWVFRHPEDHHFHMLLTARVKRGPYDGRGVIGQAASTDLQHWEALPPLTDSGLFGHMEVPQLLQHGGWWYLIFSAPESCFSSSANVLTPATGSFYLSAPTPDGPFRVGQARPLLADDQGSFYSARLIRTIQGSWQCLAVQAFDSAGKFSGCLSDPIPVEFHKDGALTVHLSSALQRR